MQFRRKATTSSESGRLALPRWLRSCVTVGACTRIWDSRIPQHWMECSTHLKSSYQWFAETSQSRVIGGVAVLVHRWVSSPTNPRLEQAYVLNMYVYPEFRRQGIARELMRTAIEWCRKHGSVPCIFTPVKAEGGSTRTSVSNQQMKCGSTISVHVVRFTVVRLPYRCSQSIRE
jgi:GNAT superfamily N-acetyltransferase